jgi:hypothetical protein
VQVTCEILLESSQPELQLCFRPLLNRRSARKVMGPQNRESSRCENFETLTWESWDKMPFRYGPTGEAQSIL